MFYTIYKVTNKINGKIYIGSHKTKYLDDGYMGSGKYLRYSINKHGTENFEKEILFVFDNADEMYAKEAELVNEEFIAESNTYNLKVGGFGGFDYINTNRIRPAPLSNEDAVKYGKQGGKKLANRLKCDTEFAKSRNEKIAEANRKYAIKHGHGTFFGKTHTKEAKMQMSLSSKGTGLGKDNSQYGTRWAWINKDSEVKKIPLDALDKWKELGWHRGIKAK